MAAEMVDLHQPHDIAIDASLPDTENHDSILQSLRFPDNSATGGEEIRSPPINKEELTTCLLCESEFRLVNGSEDILKHLWDCHKVLIADEKLIVDLKRYLDYWRIRMKSDPLSNICKTVRRLDIENDLLVDCYVLSDDVAEDKQLRQGLQKQRLEYVLQCQQQEREDKKFSRGCLFCKQKFEGTRTELFNHLADDHNFNLGQPENIVFGSKFLDLIESKLNQFQCLYCEKFFKDWGTLKEHMRKKQHKKLNPKNIEYDSFYVINYLELGKNWEAVKAEDDRDIFYARQSSDEDWEDWKEEELGIVCLFCHFTSTDIESLYNHMTESHGFDFKILKKSQKLGFYKQVKLVNYIRKEVFQCCCVYCQGKFASREDLADHMSKVCLADRIPDEASWNQPEYYFPTYENDNLLLTLECDDDDNRINGVQQPLDVEDVIAEDDELLLNLPNSIDGSLLKYVRNYYCFTKRH